MAAARPAPLLLGLLLLALAPGCACEEPDDDDTTADDDDDAPLGPVAILRPLPDEVLAGRARVRMAARTPAVASVELRVDGTAVGTDASPADGLRVDFEVAAPLPDGEVELTAVARDAAGETLGTHAVRVSLAIDPPSSAQIGPEGGALKSPQGVVMVIPPGAVPERVGMELRDLEPAAIAAELLEDGFEGYAAVDFVPTDPADADLQFLRPLDLQFPGLEPPRGGEPLVLVALGADADADGDPDLEPVASTEPSGGSVVTPRAGGPMISEVLVLGADDGVVHAGDLVELRGEGFPGMPGDLALTVDGLDVTDAAAVLDDGTRLVFFAPPQAEGAGLPLRVLNTATGAEATTSLAIAPPRDPDLDAAAADARIEDLFARADQEFDFLAGLPPGPTLSPVLGEGALLEQWRALYAAFGEALADAEPALRIQVGRWLTTTPQALAELGGGARGDSCSRLKTANTVLGVVGGVARGVAFFGGFTPVGIAAAEVQLVSSGLGAVVKGVMLFEGCYAPDGRDEGPQRFECDVVGRSGGRARGDDLLVPLLGNVLGVQEVESDSGLVPTLQFLGGTVLEPLDRDVVPWNGVTRAAGRFVLLPFLGAGPIDLLMHPAGAEAVPVSGIPAPDTPDARGYALLIAADPGVVDVQVPSVGDTFSDPAGTEAGLLDVRTHSAAVGDFDDDGLDDVLMLSSRNDVEPEGVYLDYLALGLGDGTFSSRPIGPFPLGQWGQVNGRAAGPVVDLDRDGDLDVVLLGRVSGSSGDVVTALLGDGSGGFTATELVDLDAEGCAPSGTIAVGDFVPGNGPDLLVVAANTPDGGDGAAVEGARCLFARTEDGGYAATVVPRTGRGFPNRGGGLVADFDGDGHLDAFFDLLGSVFYGDGAGGFEEVAVPPACWDPQYAVEEEARAFPAPVALDFDADGRLDPVVRNLPVPGFSPDVRRLCVLLAGPNRALTPAPASPLFVVDSAPAGPADSLTVLSAADFDADGWEDLALAAPGRADAFYLAWRRADRFVEPEAEAAVPIPSALIPGDWDGDGAVDLLVATDWLEPDQVRLNVLTDPGGSIVLALRSESGAPAAPGAVVEVDLDGDGDFDAGGELMTRAVGSGRLLIGIGDRAEVDLRVFFPDRGAGRAEVRRDDVQAGTTLELSEP